MYESVTPMIEELTWIPLWVSNRRENANNNLKVSINVGIIFFK